MRTASALKRSAGTVRDFSPDCSGVVAGGDARSKNLLKDIVVALGGIFGGEATFYSHLINESSVSIHEIPSDMHKPATAHLNICYRLLLWISWSTMHNSSARMASLECVSTMPPR